MRERTSSGKNFVLQTCALPRKVRRMNRIEAEENLRVIRSLMEKATIYRAISAPTALVGGLASVIAGGIILVQRQMAFARGGAAFSERWFLMGWGTVLLLTALANTWFLWRDARRRGERFVSSGMRHALLAMVPALGCGAGLSLFFTRYGSGFALPPTWMLCYALALLATRGFAPGSIQRLGWAFLVAGFVALFVMTRSSVPLQDDAGWRSFPSVANLLMAATFGLFHLIYAAFTWPRGGGKAGAN